MSAQLDAEVAAAYADAALVSMIEDCKALLYSRRTRGKLAPNVRQTLEAKLPILEARAAACGLTIGWRPYPSDDEPWGTVRAVGPLENGEIESWQPTGKKRKRPLPPVDKDAGAAMSDLERQLQASLDQVS